MTPINKDRLLRLAALLRQNAANPIGAKFDLNGWGNRGALFRKLGPSSVKMDCGTTACAVGLAAISGIFRLEGFSYVTALDHIGSGVVVKQTAIFPTYAGLSGFAAVNLFFGLTENESKYLFSSYDYPSNQHQGAEAELAVAARVEKFVFTDGMSRVEVPAELQ